MSVKPKGRFSRRHETHEANTAAREAYKTRAEHRPSQWWDGQRWVKATEPRPPTPRSTGSTDKEER